MGIPLIRSAREKVTKDQAALKKEIAEDRARSKRQLPNFGEASAFEREEKLRRRRANFFQRAEQNDAIKAAKLALYSKGKWANIGLARITQNLEKLKLMRRRLVAGPLSTDEACS